GIISRTSSATTRRSPGSALRIENLTSATVCIQYAAYGAGLSRSTCESVGVAPKRIALILAGAVAKGAFEAGAVQQLVRANVRIARIVATSSGALNGTLLASGVRARAVAAAAERLVELWTDHAEWNQIFHLSIADLFRGEGVFDDRKVQRLLRDNIKPVETPGDDIELRLVTAPLHGAGGSIDG